MNKAGVVLLVIGVIGLVGVYSMRPPSGFFEAFMMLGEAREYFIKRPLYEILLAVFALTCLFGLIKIATSQKNKEKE